MATKVKTGMDRHLPGAGSEWGVEVGQLHACVVFATIACNTAMTVAELVANAPNTGIGAACGPIVHSLGVAPTWCNIQTRVTAANAALTGLSATVSFQYVTADNSAAFYFAKTFTGAVPAGVGVQLLVVR